MVQCGLLCSSVQVSVNMLDVCVCVCVCVCSLMLLSPEQTPTALACTVQHIKEELQPTATIVSLSMLGADPRHYQPHYFPVVLTASALHVLPLITVCLHSILSGKQQQHWLWFVDCRTIKYGDGSCGLFIMFIVVGCIPECSGLVMMLIIPDL